MATLRKLAHQDPGPRTHLFLGGCVLESVVCAPSCVGWGCRKRESWKPIYIVKGLLLSERSPQISGIWIMDTASD